MKEIIHVHEKLRTEWWSNLMWMADGDGSPYKADDRARDLVNLIYAHPRRLIVDDARAQILMDYAAAVPAWDGQLVVKDA